MKWITRTFLLVAAVAGAAGAQAPAPAPASAGDTPSLRIAVHNETADAEKMRGAPRRDAAARPGDVLRYTLTFTNPGARALSDVQLSNPLPAGLAFIGGSVRASRTDALPEYSVDGGKSFSASPTEIVHVDGQRVRRVVPADRYTNVRWVVRGPVRPRTVVTAEYRARVGAPATVAAPSSPAATSGR